MMKDESKDKTKTELEDVAKTLNCLILMSSGNKFLLLLLSDIHLSSRKLLSENIAKGKGLANEPKISKVICLRDPQNRFYKPICANKESSLKSKINF